MRRLLPLLVLALLVPASSASAQTGSRDCAFTVLHNDHIGSVTFARGTYDLDLAGTLSCNQAVSLFAQFLQDYDGVLPRPWRLSSQRVFTRGSGPNGFTAVRVSGRTSGGGSGGGGNNTPSNNTHPSDGTLCPRFTVLNNDRIGQLVLPKGQYFVTLLPGPGLNCQGASRMFRLFLNLPSGNLPRPWVLDVETGTFTRGRSNTGFRVKPVSRRS